MKLTVLGCSGSAPGPDSPASGYLVEHDGYTLLLDLGHGAYGALQKYADPNAVDTVVVSHLHADHCIDLTAYIVGLRYGAGRFALAGPEARLHVVGPAGTRDRLEVAYDPVARKLALHDLFTFATPEDGALGPFEVRFAVMNHPVPTYAVRISDGEHSLVYSGDTGESDELVALATDADVLLCESSFGPDTEYVPNLHLTGAQAGEHAAKADVGRLLVTHIPPWISRTDVAEDAASTFDGDLTLVDAGDIYQI